MKNSCSITEIARIANVAPSTVSRVLNRKEHRVKVSAATREKIFRLVEELNYRPNQLARAMQRQSTGIIGFICGDISQPFYAELCSAMVLAAEKRDYRLMTMLTQWNFEKEIDALEQLFSRTVDGVVIVSNAFVEHNERTDRFRRPGVPVVAITDFPDSGVSGVHSDYLPGMEALFGLLHRNGYRRIALADYNRYPAKYQAYCSCARRYGIEEERFDCDDEANLDCDRLTAEIVRSKPEVVIACSDYLAIRLIPRLKRAGLRVPEDLSVVSIDGTNWSQHYNPPLTAIGHDFPAMAEAALDTLMRCLDGSSEIIDIGVPTKLQVFDSVKLTNGEES